MGLGCRQASTQAGRGVREGLSGSAHTLRRPPCAPCSGAQPMFFLDYFACGKLDVDMAEQVGVDRGQREEEASVLGNGALGR